MRIEYLADGSPDCPLVRIYGESQTELRLLADNLSSLSLAEVTEVVLSKLAGFLGEDLRAVAATAGEGPTIAQRDGRFIWTGDRQYWAGCAVGVIGHCGTENAGRSTWLLGSYADDDLIGLAVSRSSDGQW